MPDLLDALNPAQKLVARTVSGPLLVVAGAGTGKTRTLVYRLAYLVARADVPPENMLAITFTTKAAEEMRQRITSLCHDGLDLSAMRIGTIHSLCYDILRSYGSNINLPADFTIISPPDRLSIIKNLVNTFPDESGSASPRKYGLHISNEKNALVSYEKTTPLCRAYQEMLERQNLLDFEDLIIKTLELFRTVPAITAELHSRFSHISVDEYQDINAAQYSLLRSLSSPLQNICAVGDADQAIYAFRGALVENFFNFQNDFPGAQVIYLEQNYRSTKTIISAAQQVIKHNKQRVEKELHATRTPGAAIEIWHVPDEIQEAAFVAREIERLLGGTRFETMSSEQEEYVRGFSDIAVLYRLHTQGRQLKKALQQKGIPVEVATTRLLYEEPEIKPVIDFLEVIQNPHNDLALAEILTASSSAIGPKTTEKLSLEAARKGCSLFNVLLDICFASEQPRHPGVRLKAFMDLLTGLIKQSSVISLDKLIREFWEQMFTAETDTHDKLLELITSAMPFCHGPAAKGIPAFLNKISLLKDGETFTTRGEAVTLMTVHGAKGLEFPVVFILGLEDGLFPYRLEQPGGLENDEEERRLFYVGMTRAKEKLYLLHAQNRFLFGERKKMTPSVFLNDIPPAFTNKQHKNPSRKNRKSPSKQMKLF